MYAKECYDAVVTLQGMWRGECNPGVEVDGRSCDDGWMDAR